MEVAAIESQLSGAVPFFKAVNPGIPQVFKYRTHSRVVKGAFLAWKYRKIRKRHNAGESYAQITGEFVGDRVIRKVTGPVKKEVTKLHIAAAEQNFDPRRKNGMGGRSWYDGASRQRMVVVFHDANRAGPHVDVHLGKLSVVYRVEPSLYAQLRYNRDGYLTENSQKLLMEMVREKIATNSRVPQNLDHSVTNARASWVNGDDQGTNYGDGKTRQVIHESDVDIFKAHNDGPIEMYAPALNPHRSLYMFRLPERSEDAKKAPIIIWGTKSYNHNGLEDRLHLKMVDEAKAIEVADMSTATIKYDGASCYFIINRKGTTVWSPRESKRTGERIEYTHKVSGIAGVTSEAEIRGMGELVYINDETGEYIPASSTGGILNAQSVVPEGFTPEIRMYRIDKFGSDRTTEMPFWQNRELQEKTATLHDHLKVVDLCTPTDAHSCGHEGFVVVPEGGSVVNGFKVKYVDDAEDWTIKAVEFFTGPKGKVAGVVRCVNPDGKEMKLGPGQTGDEQLTRAMMADPSLFEGAVIKVTSRRGHSGRAAKVVDGLHLDKGLAPS